MSLYLSATSLKTYLTCPFQWKCSYLDRLRLARPKATLAFGTAVHASIEKRYREGREPCTAFEEVWMPQEATDFLYVKGDTHGSLLNAGISLLKKFSLHSDTPRDPYRVEVENYCEVGGEVPFYATIDFIGDAGNLLIDWKTSETKYPAYKASLDLQLTTYTYMLAVCGRMPEKIGFGVLIKKKNPEVQYLFGKRTSEDMRNFERLVRKVWHDILDGHYHRIPGMHCGYCDFAPICMGKEVSDGYYLRVPPRYAGKERMALSAVIE